jgi:hypothetical protein
MDALRPPIFSSAALRRELSGRNLALAEKIPHEATFGEIPSVVYAECDGLHGNFLPASYRRICASAEWRRRLHKVYPASRRLARAQDRVRRELDCANSSDALLMNIFCYPGVTSRAKVCALLGIEPGLRPDFGVRAHVPCRGTCPDRTEIDMRLGHLFVEAKLTESGFPTAPRALVLRYPGLQEVFEVDELPAEGGRYRYYQVIRGVLAAYHCDRSFLLLCDARRADLAEAWYAIARTVRSCEVRSRLAILTWQELAHALPARLQSFLGKKYGIGLALPGGHAARSTDLD